MVPPASHRVSRVRRYSGSCRLLNNFTYRAFTFSGLTSQSILLSSQIAFAVLYPEGITTLGLASSRFARRYFGNLFWFLFLRLLRCFSSAGLPWYDYFFHHTIIQYCCIGFPHSDICGSMDICSSPQLFAACHVLLRLLMPRHSSYALLRLTSSRKNSTTSPFFGSPDFSVSPSEEVISFFGL